MNDERRGVVLRKKRRYVLRRGCPGEACEELDHVEVLLAAVRMRLIILAWVAAPRQVLFPPQTLRFTTAGRIACSARQFVASTPSCVRKVNRASFSA